MSKLVHKRYEGSSFGSAKAAMIHDLGCEGDIVDVQEEGGFLGLFPKRVILTVAPREKKVETVHSVAPPPTKSRRLDTTLGSGSDFLQELQKKVSDNDLRKHKYEEATGSALRYNPKEVNDLLEQMFKPDRAQLEKSNLSQGAEFKLGKTSKSIPMERLQQSETLAALRHEMKCIKDEVCALRTEVKVRTGSSVKNPAGGKSQTAYKLSGDVSIVQKSFPEPYQNIYKILLDQDFCQDVAEAHIEHAMNHFSGEDKPSTDELKDYIKKSFGKTLKVEQPIHSSLSEGGKKSGKAGPKIMVLVGPTGVGKTTTMAKIASALVLAKEDPKSVAMITVDNFKMGAPEQVKEYAKGLNCPYEAVFNPAKLLPTIKKFQNKDVILIDTTGRGFRDENEISSLKDVIPEEMDTQTHLVLSATSRYQDLKKTIKAFSRLRVDALLFTKLDETSCYGPMLSILQMSLRKIAYITNGQNVPGNYKAVTPDFLADLFFTTND